MLNGIFQRTVINICLVLKENVYKQNIRFKVHYAVSGRLLIRHYCDASYLYISLQAFQVIQVYLRYLGFVCSQF
jgi:hypothetical protein